MSKRVGSSVRTELFSGDSAPVEEKKESTLEPSVEEVDAYVEKSLESSNKIASSGTPVLLNQHQEQPCDPATPSCSRDGEAFFTPRGDMSPTNRGDGIAATLKNDTPTVTPEGQQPRRNDEEAKVADTVEEMQTDNQFGKANPSPAPFMPPQQEVIGSPRTTTADSLVKAKMDATLDTTKSEISEVSSPTGMIVREQHEPVRSQQHDSSRRHSHRDDDDDSSNDESSYFADPSNLPSPKSGRHRFTSASSVNSMTNITPNRDNAYHRESDASLSLSDDSDDGMQLPPAQLQHQLMQQHTQQLVLQPRGGAGVPELYPQHPITRMHSASSLVSTSTQGYSSDDPHADDELRDATRTGRRHHHSSRNPTPTGRKSPVLGQHPPTTAMMMMMRSPSNHPPDPSPPTLWPVQGQPPNADMSQQQMTQYALQHPQPHHLSAEEMARFAQQGYFPQMPPLGLFNNNGWYQNNYGESPISKEGSALSKDSTFMYSEDSEGGRHHQGFWNFWSAKKESTASSTPNAHSSAHGSGSNNNGGTQGNSSSHSSSGPGVGVGGPGGGDGSSKNVPASLQGGFESTGKPPSSGIVNPTASKKNNGGGGGPPNEDGENDGRSGGNFKVYWRRWLMLMYMSVLNLLSDWTCYSVAPIAVLTEEAFGRINAEQLVVVFLAANGISTACEPIILSRLGLRRTVLFGALLLMMGSIVKSGGMPPIIQADLQKGHGEWRVYLGFFLVGLSQPLYQCTPALLSASWFPERERTMATGVALNANQVGIGFAFVFGTLLVETSDDIPAYFGLLSIISTLTFLGTLIQFDDAPPTPPSDTARVMRGTLEVGLPSVKSIFQSVRNLGVASIGGGSSSNKHRPGTGKSKGDSKNRSSKSKSGGKESTGKKSRSSRKSQSRRKPPAAPAGATAGVAQDRKDALAPSPSPAHYGSVYDSFGARDFPAPSPMMPGPVSHYDESEASTQQQTDNEASSQVEDDPSYSQGYPPGPFMNYPYPPMPGYPFQPPPPMLGGGFQAPGGYQPQQAMGVPPVVGTGDEGGGMMYGYGYGMHPGYGPPPPYQQPVWDPRFQQYVYLAGPVPPQMHQLMPNPYYTSYQNSTIPPYMQDYEPADNVLPPSEAIDVGAEPVLTLTPHHLDIDIRDDQIILSTRACLARPGFIHALVAFTVSGIVINTLSTFMDYLVRLNGVGREYTGIVGGCFQFGIMISSLIIGQFTDKTRAYYSVTVGMLVLGAFALAECGVNLDSDRGVELRWSLIIVALLVGPLQPVSTELGVDVVYPLSENTVLVIQQLFSNLLSAAFIPVFKAMKDIGVQPVEETREQPEYTFSFYVLIVLHAAATVFFATFNGRYLRYEHELMKKEKAEIEEERRQNQISAAQYPPGQRMYNNSDCEYAIQERQSLIPPVV